MLRFPLLAFRLRLEVEPKLAFDGDGGGECQAEFELERRRAGREYDSDVGDLVSLVVLNECGRVWLV